METAQSSETWVSTHYITWCGNQENHEFYLHCCENLTSCNEVLVSLDKMHEWEIKISVSVITHRIIKVARHIDHLA